MPQPFPQNLIGRSLAGYRILGELGHGGMAVVLKAEDRPPLKRHVAIKVLRPEHGADRDVVQRFLDGAKAEARLDHPGIVTIHGVGEDDGVPYIVMELVKGLPLSRVVAKGEALPPSRRHKILLQVAEALDFAHCQRMVHRDVKPGNVMVGEDDKTTLLDFGLVKQLDGGGHTRIGTIMGTPEYMSPEQSRGEKVGPPSDIYSLGVLAFRLMTGRVPFCAEHSAAVLHKHAYEEPPRPRKIDPRISPDAERVLLKALAKDPHRRWSSASEFVRALLAAEGAADGGMKKPPSKTPPWLVALLVGMVMVAGVIALSIGGGGDPDRGDASSRSSAGAGQQGSADRVTGGIEDPPSATATLVPTDVPATRTPTARASATRRPTSTRVLTSTPRPSTPVPPSAVPPTSVSSTPFPPRPTPAPTRPSATAVSERGIQFYQDGPQLDANTSCTRISWQTSGYHRVYVFLEGTSEGDLRPAVGSLELCPGKDKDEEIHILRAYYSDAEYDERRIAVRIK